MKNCTATKSRMDLRFDFCKRRRALLIKQKWVNHKYTFKVRYYSNITFIEKLSSINFHEYSLEFANINTNIKRKTMARISIEQLSWRLSSLSGQNVVINKKLKSLVIVKVVLLILRQQNFWRLFEGKTKIWFTELHKFESSCQFQRSKQPDKQYQAVVNLLSIKTPRNTAFWGDPTTASILYTLFFGNSIKSTICSFRNCASTDFVPKKKAFVKFMLEVSNV